MLRKLQLNIRYSEDEKTRWEQAAQGKRLTLAEYVRALIEADIRKTAQEAERVALMQRKVW